MSIPTRLGVAALVVGLALSLFAHRVVPPILADRVLDVPARTVLGPESALPVVGSVRLVLGGVVPPSAAAEFTRIALIVGARLGRPVEVRRVESDEVAARLLTTGGADVAYVCGGAYVDMRQRARVDLLAARATPEGPVARSALVVRADSAFHSLADLGRIELLRVAYVETSSVTGHDLPRALLRRSGVALARSRPVWSGSAERSMQLVASGRADVAGIDRLALERVRAEAPELASRLRVLEVSEPEAAPAFVAAAGLPGALRALLSMALSDVGSTAEGQAILDDLGIVAFVPVEDRLYDGVRSLRRPGEDAR